tara:strand:+ start:1087 stop:2136 length:1050 start_codon:yes stop_codon:yes gene_type:complete
LNDEVNMTAIQTDLIGGVHYIGIGVSNMKSAISFWESCGYNLDTATNMTASLALRLYGLNSNAKVSVLKHQNATSGLIKLIQWEKPSGSGLQMAPLRTHGCRWSVHRTDNIANAYIHGEMLKRAGKKIYIVGPHYNFDLGKPEGIKKPFNQFLSTSGDVLLFQPEAQLVAMTRINFDVSKYGTININSPLRLSEGCHMALVVQGDDLKIFDFYDEIIGFKKYQKIEISYKRGSMASDMFELSEGESFTEVDFDDPESGDKPNQHLPGRLRCFLLKSSAPADNRIIQSQPGNLGYSFYSFKTQNIYDTHQRVEKSNAKKVSNILTDEFGFLSFSFFAPDGFFWVARSATL